MKKKFVLPSLFVLNAFLVGLTPKTSRAGTTNTKPDSVLYDIKMDSCNWLPQSCLPVFAKSFAQSADSAETQAENEDSVSYTISWQGKSWVKYTAEDGSGFIRTGGSRTWRNMNPGALRPGEISRQYGSCGSAGGFAVFPTEEHGMNALRALLRSDKYTNLTIAAAIYKYAPPSDNNNTRLYQQRLSRMTGLSLKKRMKHLTSDELERVMRAIMELEGWKSGHKESFGVRTAIAKSILDYQKILKYKKLNQKQYLA